MGDDEPIATEFDSTTKALFNGFRELGVPESALHEDMIFLVDVFRQVTSPQINERFTSEQTQQVMDCAFLGLTYHRHMPFQMENEGGGIDLGIPERAANDYIFTLTALTNALVRQGVATDPQVIMAATEGALLARQHIRDVGDRPDSMVDELCKHFMTWATIGMVIHRLMPHSKVRPQDQGVHGLD